VTERDEIALDDATIKASLDHRARAQELAQEEADKLAHEDPPLVSGSDSAGKSTGTVVTLEGKDASPAKPEDSAMSLEEADATIQVAGAWLLPSSGLFAPFNDEERKALSPHVAKMWNKYFPWLDLKYKDEIAAAFCVAVILGKRKQLLDEAEKKKAAEAARTDPHRTDSKEKKAA
jgi:hypothetical protein